MYLLAHSMGNRALLFALDRLAIRGNAGAFNFDKFRHLIMLAPGLCVCGCVGGWVGGWVGGCGCVCVGGCGWCVGGWVSGWVDVDVCGVCGWVWMCVCVHARVGRVLMRALNGEEVLVGPD